MPKLPQACLAVKFFISSFFTAGYPQACLMAAGFIVNRLAGVVSASFAFDKSSLSVSEAAAEAAQANTLSLLL